jgi:hypothetical protein
VAVLTEIAMIAAYLHCSNTFQVRWWPCSSAAGSLASKPYLTRLAVRDRGRTRVLDVNDIDWIGPKDERVMVHVGDGVCRICCLSTRTATIEESSVMVDEVDVEKQQRALDCYVTYRETIETAGAKRNIPREAVFEIYQEAHDPPLNSLFGGLTED